VTDDNIGNSQQQTAAELKRVRQAAGMSQEQMATRLGMDYAPGGRKVSTGRATVSAWERGRRPLPAQYLEAYLDLGGDPAILTPGPDTSSGELAIDLPAAADSASRSEPVPAASAGPTVASDPLPRRGLHWRWLAFSAIVVVAAAGSAFFVVAFRSEPEGPAPTWTETTGTPAHTWANPVQLTGAGTPLGPQQSVQVMCRIQGWVVPDGDPWWYRLASEPWNGNYYATSDAFYNNGATSGSVDTGVVVDDQVPVCSGG
jgi:transcriptional regulator with XRE-family HTH domain